MVQSGPSLHQYRLSYIDFTPLTIVAMVHLLYYSAFNDGFTATATTNGPQSVSEYHNTTISAIASASGEP